MTTSGGRLGLIADRTSMLFLAAGGFLLVFAGLMGYQAFVDTSVTFADNEADFFGPVGLLCGFLGLLGLYPSLADRRPTLARVGAAAATAGIAGAAVIAVGTLAILVGVLTEPPAWAPILSLGVLLAMVGGYPVFAIGSLRTGIQSRTVALLLLAPVAIFVVMLSGGLNTILGTGVARFVLASGQAAAHLALGLTLLANPVPSTYGGTEPSPAEVQHE